MSGYGVSLRPMPMPEDPADMIGKGVKPNDPWNPGPGPGQDPNFLDQWHQSLQSDLAQSRDDHAQLARDQIDHDDTLFRLKTGTDRTSAMETERSRLTEDGSISPDGAPTTEEMRHRKLDWSQKVDEEALQKKLGKPSMDWDPRPEGGSGAPAKEISQVPSSLKGVKDAKGAKAMMGGGGGGNEAFMGVRGARLDIPDFRVSNRGPIIRPWEDPSPGSPFSDERVKTGVTPQGDSELDQLTAKLQAKNKVKGGASGVIRENPFGDFEQKKADLPASTQKAIDDAEAMKTKLLAQMSGGPDIVRKNPFGEDPPKPKPMMASRLAAPKPAAPAAPTQQMPETTIAADPQLPPQFRDNYVPPEWDLSPFAHKPPQFNPSTNFDYRQDASK